MKTVHAFWDDAEQSTIRIELAADWSWKAVYDLVPEVHAMMDEVSHPVHFIVLPAEDTIALPPSSLQHLRDIPTLWHPNTGVTVIVTNSTVVDIIMGLLQQVYQKGFRTIINTGKLEDARAIIAKRNQLAV
ncbi:MAG: hypothetical protein KC496_08455 [Anaerolineae bacterium]|nr:hypothetical protein [Anaerolineae bacterium]